MTRKICPTCHGRGKIPNPKGNMYISEIDCPNCNGEGFVGMPDVLPIRKSTVDIYTKANAVEETL